MILSSVVIQLDDAVRIHVEGHASTIRTHGQPPRPHRWAYIAFNNAHTYDSSVFIHGSAEQIRDFAAKLALAADQVAAEEAKEREKALAAENS